MTEALILVDIQNDFCPGGTLAVRDGGAVVKVANALIPRFSRVVATQDFHPPSHLSFAANHVGKNLYDVVEIEGLSQVLWPTHCVRDTFGSEFHPELERTRLTRVFPKGTDERIDSYSGFFDNGRRKATGLGSYLKDSGVTDVYVMGLATDYCVKWTALDAVSLEFRVHLVEDGCRGVGLAPSDIPNALEELARAGVRLSHSAEVMANAR